MSGMEFAASLVSALAWPVTLVIILTVFRATIRDSLAAPVKRWKAGPSGVEIEYERVASEARKALPPDADQRAGQVLGGGLSGELDQVAATAPSVAIAAAFQRVETELRRITEGLEPADTLKRVGVRQLAVIAQRHGHISDASFNAINGLTVMRNLATHGKPGGISTEEALEFVHLCDAVLYAISNEEAH